MSEQLRKKIKEMESDLEKQVEIERRKFWSDVYSLSDTIDGIIKEKFGVEPERAFYDDEYGSDMPTKYSSALYEVSKAILNKGFTVVSKEGKNDG